MKYSIYPYGAESLGEYEGSHPTEAIEQMLIDAGYDAEIENDTTVLTDREQPCGMYSVVEENGFERYQIKVEIW